MGVAHGTSYSQEPRVPEGRRADQRDAQQAGAWRTGGSARDGESWASGATGEESAALGSRTVEAVLAATDREAIVLKATVL
jgi:hypothetical protein